MPLSLPLPSLASITGRLVPRPVLTSGPAPSAAHPAFHLQPLVPSIFGSRRFPFVIEFDPDSISPFPSMAQPPGYKTRPLHPAASIPSPHSSYHTPRLTTTTLNPSSAATTEFELSFYRFNAIVSPPLSFALSLRSHWIPCLTFSCSHLVANHRQHL